MSVFCPLCEVRLDFVLSFVGGNRQGCVLVLVLKSCLLQGRNNGGCPGGLRRYLVNTSWIIKVHKIPWKIHGIVSYCGNTCYSIGCWTDQQLQTICKLLLITISNSKALKNNLRTCLFLATALTSLS